MARGNQGRKIYRDERDRKLWLVALGQACEKTGWRIHAWVMMNNHYPSVVGDARSQPGCGDEMAAGHLHPALGLKRGRKELAGEWKAIRRGWYVGGAEFKERMLALVEQPLRQGRSGSYSGEAKRAHGEAEAERLLAGGLAALGLTEAQLVETRKGAWEKELLAWWLCQHNTARRRWVSERLGLGDESRVTQAIGRVKQERRAELERLKRRLEQVYENHTREAEV
jgi:hypothetical protein